MAIKPNFHRDNFIDKKYHHLSIDFFEFTVLADEFNYYLQIKDLDNEKISKIEIPIYQHFKDRNRIARKLNNSEPLTYEERKLFEIDVNNFPVNYGGERPNTYKFDHYDSLNGLVDLALEKWRQRL
ncbi:hypothetical protein [Nostoc sp.]|uniref:hypothetical protein n=1 Tax=Nostoc sp. TaxID=1180 RepID=UPI0035938D50